MSKIQSPQPGTQGSLYTILVAVSSATLGLEIIVFQICYVLSHVHILYTCHSFSENAYFLLSTTELLIHLMTPLYESFTKISWTSDNMDRP